MTMQLELRRIIRGAARRINRLFPSKLPAQKAWTSPVDVAVICPSYPGKNNSYGGQFVQSRVKAYCESGLSVAVIVSRPDSLSDYEEQVDGISVWRTHPQQLARYLKKQFCRRIVLHHPEADNWTIVAHHAERTRPLVIFHGYEARPWRVLESSYSADEIAEFGDWLDARDDVRRKTAADVLSHNDVMPIFVSQTMKNMAESFSGITAPHNAQIIHNPILPSEFPYQRKSIDDRYKILWMRSFQSHNYANDLSRDVILALSKRRDFDRFKITICGDGKLWEQMTAPLAHFTNVERRRGFMTRPDVARLHREHGIMLVPARWESQGLTLGEAMASGLVPVTNSIAAVPEFISHEQGCLCPPEDVLALAKSIGYLVDNPETFLRLSQAAAQRSLQQCGPSQTVMREADLLRGVI